jgi:Asp-tRNA(Asn)/Glu-tRNA(Gln) amidotransferase C subunit
MANRARRQNIAIPEEMRLFTEELPKLTEETQEITQVFHKVNKSKVNILKEKDTNVSLSNAQACASEQERERFLEIFTFVKNFHNPQQEVERFVAHYDASGWCRKDSTVPVKNKEALAQMWKPQQEGQRFPEEVRQWLFETYCKAKATSPEAARCILTQVAMAVLANGRARIDCSQEAARAIEQFFAFRPAWGVIYRIPN